MNGLLTEHPGAPPQPGETCPTCKRRVNHARKPDSPTSRVKSLRIPADDGTFDEDFARALLTVGLTSQHKFPPYKFLRFVMDCIFRDEAYWAGAYLREYEGVGSGAGGSSAAVMKTADAA